MDTIKIELLIRELKEILQLLVGKQYEALERKTSGVRLSADEMRSSVDNYGRTLILPPVSAYANLDLIEVRNSDPKRYSLCFDLWTAEEGCSDLTLEATVIEANGTFRWEMDDIHVR